MNMLLNGSFVGGLMNGLGNIMIDLMSCKLLLNGNLIVLVDRMLKVNGRGNDLIILSL